MRKKVFLWNLFCTQDLYDMQNAKDIFGILKIRQIRIFKKFLTISFGEPGEVRKKICDTNLVGGGGKKENNSKFQRKFDSTF